MKTKLILALVLSLFPLALSAQLARSPATTAVTMPTAGRPAIPTLSLGLKANEAIRTFDVPVQSDEDKPVQVFGAQTTAGLYIVDYPKTISAKGRSTLTLIYIAQPNSSSEADFVKLLTDHGEKVVRVAHDREQVAQLDTASLQWAQDEALVPKSVTITVAPNSAVPKSVKVLGAGATANLQSLGSNKYRVTVTPASTAKPLQFPVGIQFVPALPGLPSIISCAVTPKS